MEKKGFVKVERKDPNKKPSVKKAFKKALQTFLHIEDELNGEKVVLDLLNDLLSSEDISSEVDKVSVGYAFLGVLCSYAEQRYLDSKIDCDKLYSLLDERAREGEITVRVTDAKVRAWVERQPEYVQMCKSMNKSKRQYRVFWYAAESMQLKKDMLQTKSANARHLNSMSNTFSEDKREKQ